MYPAEIQKKFYEDSKHFLSQPAGINELEALKSILRYHEWKYYIQNDPVVSDHEYDLLFKQLQAIESAHPELISADSPSQRVATDLITSFNTVKHIVPMLSLENSYNEEDLKDFDAQIKKLTALPPEEKLIYAVEPKFDGGSIALVYEDDILVRAATRGNGLEGEEITQNIKVLQSVPLRAPFSSLGMKKVELRGEALISKKNFEAINQNREDEGQVLFANPRNAATGGLRTKDPMETKRRGIEAFMFQAAYAVDEEGNNRFSQFNTHFGNIEKLGELGFKIPKAEKKLCTGIEEVVRFCLEWQEKRDSYDYEIDGMVVKVNDYSLQEICGSTAHHPRWAIAFKFKAKQATSKLLAVEYQVGKIGSITPVAKIQPIALAGVTVSSISLHNEDFIKGKDIRLGDTVLVERAGDVIPYIVKSMEELRDGSETIIEFPEFCPVNTQATPVALVKEEGESAWRCPHCICGKQDLQRMIFHVSKDAMDIDGFGKSYVERFYEMGWLSDMADIYNLDYDKIAELEGFGIKSAEKLKTSINKARKNPIHKLLHSLSIHHLGKKASKLIAEQIHHVLDLRQWSREKFLDIKDIGPVVADNVIEYFSDDANIIMLQKMEGYGVNLTQTDEDKPLEVATDGIFSGKTILFTGTLTSMGRKQAEELAAKHGAKNISAVSSNLNILVVGEKAGSKLTKAKSIGTVEIMTEQEFVDAIQKIES
ncbi:MAG: NAD-dependent DNA ligase LigA [Saprospiraceae bacterium]|jgi:DNA ligase (NAD+)|nr:NAD-dependent DNA ligase LigA [Saprospiraceae bacterium]